MNLTRETESRETSIFGPEKRKRILNRIRKTETISGRQVWDDIRRRKP